MYTYCMPMINQKSIQSVLKNWKEFRGEYYQGSRSPSTFLPVPEPFQVRFSCYCFFHSLICCFPISTTKFICQHLLQWNTKWEKSDVPNSSTEKNVSLMAYTFCLHLVNKILAHVIKLLFCALSAWYRLVQLPQVTWHCFILAVSFVKCKPEICWICCVERKTKAEYPELTFIYTDQFLRCMASRVLYVSTLKWNSFPWTSIVYFVVLLLFTLLGIWTLLHSSSCDLGNSIITKLFCS